MAEPLTIRSSSPTGDDAARLVADRITTRTLHVRAETINEEDRSVQATLTTETPVRVYDWNTGRAIDEILRADGAELPPTGQLVLLANHNRWDLDAVLGSTRQINAKGGDLIGRLFFADQNTAAESAWQLTRQGHLTDVSAGYRVLESEDLAPGERRTVKGRTYRARGRTLRITTRWQPREISLTPIGADPAATVRSEPPPQPPQETPEMNANLRAYLQEIGLADDASEADAVRFWEALDGSQRAIADTLATTEEEKPDPAAAETPDPGRAAPETPGTGQSAPGMTQTQAEEVARQAIARERDRQTAIRGFCTTNGMTDAFRDQGLREGWTIEQTSQRAWTEVQEGRAAGHQAPAGHTRSHDADCNQDTLATALAVRGGVDPIRFGPVVEADPDRAEQVANVARQYEDLSLMDIAREAVRLDGHNVPRNRHELVQRAMSGSTLLYIFSTSANAVLQQSYTQTPDSTATWCREVDVPNFLTNERPRVGQAGALTKHARGGEASHATFEDTRETYKAFRYSKQFAIDEMDVIDGLEGALSEVPQKLGSAARRVRPSLVYSILLANAALSDTGALFNATAVTSAGGHANLTTAALGSAGLQAGIVSMGKQKDGSVDLDIQARTLLVPRDLVFTARELVSSANIIIAGDTDTVRGERNVLADEDLSIVGDNRIGAAGCTDPATETAYTGLATNWFLFASVAQAAVIEVGYVRGTGRKPTLRSERMTGGAWGFTYDVKLDIGAKALDWRGGHKSTGAG
jgi:hypothetical protein